MINPTKIKATLCILLGLVSFAVRAEIGSGSFSNDFSGIVNLWDISGTYTEDVGFETETYTIVMDANGVITGDGTFHYNDGSALLDGDFTISGQAKGAGSSVKVTLLLTIANGSGNVQGFPVTFTASLKENLTLDDSSHELVGKAGGRVTVTVPSLGRTVTRGIPSSPTSTDLDASVDGLWGLSLTLAPDGTTYSGLASINLSNGKTVALDVAGTYSSSADLSKLTLTGSDPDFPVSLNLVAGFNGSNITINALKGKALGQKPKFVNK